MLDRRRAADARECPRLERRDQQALRLRRQVLDAVDEQHAAGRLLEHAGVNAIRIFGAVQRRGRAFIAHARRDQLHERPRRARAERMNVARERFASGAGLADDEHRRLMRSDLLDLLAQRVHRAALADRRDQRRHQRAAGLPLVTTGIERALDRAQQLGERQRLLDEIECAEPRRFDRGLDRAVARHHDDRAGRAVRLRPFAQQRDAVGVGHPDIEQHQIGIVLRAARRAPRRRRRRRPLHSLRPRGSPCRSPRISVRHRRPVCALHSCPFPPRSGTPFANRPAAATPQSSGNSIRTRAPPVRTLSASMAAAMFFDYFLHDRQPQARAFRFGRYVRIEHLADHVRPEPRSIVLDDDLRRAAGRRSAPVSISRVSTRTDGFGTPSSASMALASRL